MNNGPPFFKQYQSNVKVTIIVTPIPQADIIDKNTQASDELYKCMYFLTKI